jgi:uncharacterized protein DUF6970
MKIIYIGLLNFLIGCSAVKKNSGVAEMPSCLNAKIKSMAANPKEGSPQSVMRYTYNNQTVYYLVSSCCDKYNVVYDSACNILGYPDGGYTGKGDGKMANFKNEASDGKVIWKKE